MIDATKYYDEEVLVECIRFNTHFFELNCGDRINNFETKRQYNELKLLVDEYHNRHYKETPVIEWADNILREYACNHAIGA